MINKKECSSLSLIYDHGCLSYNSKLECKTCDGLGKNSDKKIEIERCYTTKNHMRNDLDLKDNINNPYQ